VSGESNDRDREHTAAIYSLMETAKLDGLDPQAHLREVPTRIADPPSNRIDELLPWNIARDTPREQPLVCALVA